jgi:hypothetical protein
VLARRKVRTALRFVTLAIVVVSCSPASDARTVMIVGSDQEVVCFVDEAGRRLCPGVNNAQPLRGLTVGECARVRFAGQTLEVGSADQVECPPELREVDITGVPGLPNGGPTTTSVVDPPATDGLGSTNATSP